MILNLPINPIKQVINDIANDFSFIHHEIQKILLNREIKITIKFFIFKKVVK